MSALVWFRNDLRVRFNRSLAAAQASGLPVKAVYLLCAEQWRAHQVAPVRQKYVLESLLELGDALAAAGICLDVLDAGGFAEVPRLLSGYVRQHEIRSVYCCREYPLNELRRDQQVARSLQTLGVSIQGVDDTVLVPPQALKTGQGGTYTVFTPYRKRWDAWLEHNPPGEPASQGKRNKAGRPVVFAGQALVLKALAALRSEYPDLPAWPAGEKAAQQRLEVFIGESLPAYQRQRDVPSQPGTSVLSTALSAGTLSAAQCWLAAASAGAGEGGRAWCNELAWRDFYRQILADHRQLSMGEPFRKETAFIQWSRNQSLFDAWCQGKTGYPFVDAGMRQLLATGWMHNRVRMVVAMFLTKNLFIDWRWGESWFMQHLVDGDFAANNGGWQWSASTGTDAAPYFRVFNPVRQGQRFDPDGDYIRRWVPELAHLNSKEIHEPWRVGLPSAAYPRPVVGLEGVRERVTAAFRGAREMYEFTAQSG